MAGLLDFLQSASNTAADTVAAPVDLLAWALRKAGVPVPQNAIGGSEWLKQQGLKRDVPQSAASLAGETVGLLSPMVAAAKAPQIAKGLLQVEANAMAPSTLPRMSDRGAIMWHGSPHKFDKFDASKIGTGEGAQAYGHGLYLAQSPDVAKTYTTAGTSAATKQSYQFDDPLQRAAATVEKAGGDVGWAIKRLTIDAERGDAVATKAAEALQGGAKLPDLGLSNLYKVDLPDNMISRMLDWDKPLRQQPVGSSMAVVKNESPAFSDEKWLVNIGDTTINAYKTKREATAGLERATGQDLWRALDASGARAGTDRLRQQGIPGIRYLDGSSRSAGQGTSNFVVFPGEEQYLRILERNGGLLAP